MSATCQSTANRIKRLFWIVLLLGVMLLCNCTERQLASPTPQMDIEQRFWVRVLLLNNVRTATLKTESSFNILAQRMQPGTTYCGHKGEIVTINMSAGIIHIAGRPFPGNQVVILPGAPYIFSLDGHDYRGKLKLIPNPGGKSFSAINLVPLEPYLAGVVGAEMPDYWEPTALRAQAIAARTYCLYIKKRFGSKRNWDVSKTQANQVYRGVCAESAQVWAAVNKTGGQVLVCKGPDGEEDIFPTYYSSTCGGHTANSSKVFGDSFETLTGVPCPYCKNIAKPRFFFWPTAQFDKSDVTARLLKKYPKLKHLKEITSIRPVTQSNYGQFSRLTSVKLKGLDNKSEHLRAEDLRLVIDPTGRKIRSTICKIISIDDKWAFVSGRGWGHGVGMCQCGAQGMAREGKSTRQILSYYYPGSRIVNIY